MQELVLNKDFETREEMENFEKELNEKYIVFMIMRKDQTIGEPEKFGIDKVVHFGKR